MRSDDIRVSTRILATLGGCVAVGVPLLTLEFVALIVYGMRCDEGCGGGGWKGDPTAWQWAAQYWGFAIPALVTGAATLILVGLGRPRGAAIALGITCALAGGWFAFPMITDTDWSLIAHPFLELSGLAYLGGDRSDWPYLAFWLMTLGGVITIGGEAIALRRGR